MPCYRTGAILLLALIVAAPLAMGGDAVTDAKRKAAADLMKEGKTTDAIALISEVLKADPDNYKDHLLLARGYDKLNKTQEAVDAYRRVLELLGNSEDRTAKTEADRRLKVLDAQSAKIRAAEDEFLKKIDSLEREAIAARDMRAIAHIFRLKSGIWAAQSRIDAAGIEVSANGEWQTCRMAVKAGATYRIRAAGTWIIADTPCSADGLADRSPIAGGAMGVLIVAVSGELAKYHAAGTNTRFTAGSTGHLTFICNMPTQTERTKNIGTVHVIVQEE